jgi:hypothetical protein
MPLYTVSRARAALNTSQDLLTIVASATKPLRIYVVDIKGMDTASAYNEVLMQRSTIGTTPGGAITPSKVNPSSGAASFAAYTTWSVQPALSGEILWRFGPNSNGGIDKDVVVPGFEWSVPGSGVVSFRSAAGTGNVVINVKVEEIDG